MLLKLVLTALTLSLSFPSDSTGGLMSMFWNLENFFNYTDDGNGASDREFSPDGARHWTVGRFYAKCNAISKSIYWIGDEFGKLPDVIGVAEIESRDVLTRLLGGTSLRKARYSIIHYESNDHRGIDTALLWRRDKLKFVSSKACHIEGLQTRDILLAEFEYLDMGETITFAVVHLPSKYGGGKTAWKRELAANRLKQVADSVKMSGCDRVIVMGDFNDVPSASEFDVLKPELVNLSVPLFGKGEGTIRFNGKWNLIDMFWVSGELENSAKMSVVNIPFLMVWDNTMSGFKPLRTYLGPRYAGGVSDHCPIVLELFDRASESDGG